jgi:outer membrane protein OmpA-like peptidoglycan-associated protein/outer membrane protein W
MRTIMKVKLLAGVAALGLMTATAASADPNGWYGAVDAGFHSMEDGINAESSTTGANWNWEVNDGWAAFARLGYRFDANWRLELEGGYRSGDIGTVRAISGTQGLCNLTPATGGCFSPEGDITSTTLMANLIYDFGAADAPLRPFVGLGVGVNRVNADAIGNLRANRTAAMAVDDSSTEFAAQAIAGLAWAISERTSLDLTYRYLTGDAAWASTTAGTGVGATAFGAWEGDYDQSHTVSLGLRYSFGAIETPPPPPVPVPPPAPTPAPPPPPPAPAPRPAPQARQFVVYFDWDRSTLTAEAQQVVSQAAAYARSGNPTRVLVVGHTDTSGSAAYNLGLSNRRARTVADALVAAGVNGGVISLDGRGETQLARATADGVREPLNRRATVDINF